MMTNIEKCFADVKEEIAAAIKELMEKNRENGDNDYANGVHDGYLDVLMKLGIDIDEEYCN